MNQTLQAHLEAQGIRVGATTIKPCWLCRDKKQYDYAQAQLAKGEDYGRWNSSTRWHPWHNGQTEMPEWSLLQRLLFRLRCWTPVCECRACNGSGICYSTEMSHA